MDELAALIGAMLIVGLVIAIALWAAAIFVVLGVICAVLWIAAWIYVAWKERNVGR